MFGSRKQSKMVLNYFKLFLIPQFEVLGLVMQYLSLDTCFRLKLISHSKSISRDPTLTGSFEVQFFKAIIQHRLDYSHPSEEISKTPSKLCQLLALFLVSKFHLTKDQERELVFNQRKSNKRNQHFNYLNMSADTASLTGIGFEIQKDVDRTFIDSEKFTQVHRNSLATVLKTYAALDSEIGYVQGLNFIVGNFIILFHRDNSDGAQRRCESKVLSSFFGLLSVLKIRDFYTEQMLGIKEAIFKLECILYNLIPEVYIYLMQNQITLEYFASQWFLTLFQYDISNHEQSMMIILLSLFFGPKILYQIAFQMIKEIRNRLVNFSYEEALVYLKDYAGEPRFGKVEFLMRALENDLITDQLIKDLGKVYSKFSAVYSEKELHKFSFLDPNPLSQRVRFLRGSIPGKINVKVIWPKPDMSESPEEVKTEMMIDISPTVTRFSLGLETKNNIVNGEQLRVDSVQAKPKNFRQMIKEIHQTNSKGSLSLLVASEESTKQQVQATKQQSSKRMGGSFVVPIGARMPASQSYSDLLTVSDQSKNRGDMAAELKLTVVRPTDFKQSVSKKADQDIRIYTQGNVPLFERLGMHTATSQAELYSKSTKNTLFSFAKPANQPSDLQEKQGYTIHTVRHQNSLNSSEVSDKAQTGIRIIAQGYPDSSSSKTDSNNDVSQETDQLESENSYPLMLRMQQSSAMRVHRDHHFEEEELVVGNEYNTIDPPLFLSPHASSQMNSRALYVRDTQRHNINTNVMLSARHIKGEPQVRPGTKTKLEQKIQPTQSNFDVESDINTLSHLRLPTSPVFQEQLQRTQKLTVSTNALKLSENIVESDKRLKNVNNIALTGAGFDPKKQGRSPAVRTKQMEPASRNVTDMVDSMFEHLPLKETVKIKHPVTRLPQTMTPDPIAKTIDVPLSTDRPVPNIPIFGQHASQGIQAKQDKGLPSQHMQVLRNQETKRMQQTKTLSSQVTEEDQPLTQQNAPVFMHKFVQLSKELQPKGMRESSKAVTPADYGSAMSSDSSPAVILDDRKRKEKSKKVKHQANYNTKDNATNFSTVRFATQHKSHPMPKLTQDSPNMIQTLTRPLQDMKRYQK